MLRSFRFKIGLFSFGLAGLLLLGFAFFATATLHRVGRERIDYELRALADAQVRRIQPPGHWQRFDVSLQAIYGDTPDKRFLIKAIRLNGEALYASTDWPPELPAETLPLSLAGAAESVLESPSPRGGHPSPRPGEERRSPPAGEAPRMPVRGPVYADLGGAEGAWRAMTIANADVVLSIAMNLSGLQAEIRRFQRVLLAAFGLGLLAVAAGGWLIGHLALRPVDLIARTAESLDARRLDGRIPAGQADEEFQRLIALINGMLERLEKSFRQATRFSADAAHELKTPLAILQAYIERALRRAPDGSPEQRECAEQLDEAQRLRAILRKLLLLSQADAGQLPIAFERVNLADLARAAADDVQMLAPDRKTTVQAPTELWVRGDADLLNQAIENLTSNAVKFGETKGAIAIAAEIREGRAVVSLANSGSPISPGDRDKIFERFYRGDPSRSRVTEGTGLGLSLAREIVRAHAGDLLLVASDARQTVFELTLPLAAPGTPAG